MVALFSLRIRTIGEDVLRVTCFFMESLRAAQRAIVQRSIGFVLPRIGRRDQPSNGRLDPDPEPAALYMKLTQPVGPSPVRS
jgi:hypothetical protein